MKIKTKQRLVFRVLPEENGMECGNKPPPKIKRRWVWWLTFVMRRWRFAGASACVFQGLVGLNVTPLMVVHVVRVDVESWRSGSS